MKIKRQFRWNESNGRGEFRDRSERGLSEEVAFVQNGTVLESEAGYGGKPRGMGISEQSPWMLFLNKSTFMPQQEAGACAATWG